MKHRERVAAALRFERPDRLPCDESFWDGTLQQWRAEGMRADVDAADYFDFDLCWMALDASPRLEQEILRREGGMITYRDRFGYTATKQDGLSSSIAFWMHSCGVIEPVIDDLVEVGLAVLNPLQANAGLDAVVLRRRYGRRLAFYGNIDVRKILGSQEELLAELRRKVPLARDGGFVFHSDHSIPPQVGFERYAWMLRTARELFHS